MKRLIPWKGLDKNKRLKSPDTLAIAVARREEAALACMADEIKEKIMKKEKEILDAISIGMLSKPAILKNKTTVSEFFLHSLFPSNSECNVIILNFLSKNEITLRGVEPQQDGHLVEFAKRVISEIIKNKQNEINQNIRFSLALDVISRKSQEQKESGDSMESVKTLKASQTRGEVSGASNLKQAAASQEITSLTKEEQTFNAPVMKSSAAKLIIPHTEENDQSCKIEKIQEKQLRELITENKELLFLVISESLENIKGLRLNFSTSLIELIRGKSLDSVIENSINILLPQGKDLPLKDVKNILCEIATQYSEEIDKIPDKILGRIKVKNKISFYSLAEILKMLGVDLKELKNTSLVKGSIQVLYLVNALSSRSSLILRSREKKYGSEEVEEDEEAEIVKYIKNCDFYRTLLDFSHFRANFVKSTYS